MELIFASKNKDKIKEIRELFKSFNVKNTKILTLEELKFSQFIEESGNSYEENAYIKAKYIYEYYKKPSFADDSGLEVYKLNNKPGIFSSTFAGINVSNYLHINKLLSELKDINDRKAKFVCVICLILSNINEPIFFRGELEGEISYKIKGNNGFGYDPIFIPNGYDKTLAELTLVEKNKISHRAIAVKKLINYLTKKLN